MTCPGFVIEEEGPMERDSSKKAPRRRRKANVLPPIAETIVRLRMATGLTQAMLARDSGLSVPTISRLEKGDLRISAKNLERLLNFFGMTLAAVDVAAKSGSQALEQVGAEDVLAKW